MREDGGDSRRGYGQDDDFLSRVLGGLNPVGYDDIDIDRGVVSIEPVVRQLSRRLNMEVRVHDAGPMMAGKVVWLPRYVFSQQEADNLLAAAAHESYHAKHTSSRVNPADAGIYQDCMQVLEDIRINHKMFKDYKGVKQMYRGFVRWALNRNKHKYPPEYAQLVMIAAQAEGHGKMVWDPVAGVRLRRDPVVQSIVAQTRNARGTKHVIPLALQLGKHLFPSREKTQQDQKRAGEALQKMREEVGGLTSKHMVQESARDAAARKLTDYEAEQASHHEETTQEERDQTQADIEKHTKEVDDHQEAMQQTKKQLAELEYSPEFKKAQEDSKKAQRALEDVKQVVQKLARAVCMGLSAATGGLTKFDPPKFSETLRAMVHDVVSRSVETVQQAESGRINRRSLHKAYTKPDDIWESPTRKRKPDARIIFLLDYSSSMNDALKLPSAERQIRSDRGLGQLCRINLLHDTFMRFSKALVDVSEEYEEGAVSAAAVWFSDSAEPVWGFGKHFATEVKNANKLPYSGGGTNLYDALVKADKMLRAEDEKACSGTLRKLMVVLTDTEYYSDMCDRFMEQELDPSVQLVCVSIGTPLREMSEETRQLFRHSVMTEDEVEDALIDVLEEGIA